MTLLTLLRKGCSMNRRYVRIFLLAFGVSALLLTGYFILGSRSLADVPFGYSVVGGVLVGLLTVLGLWRLEEQPTLYRPPSEWVKYDNQKKREEQLTLDQPPIPWLVVLGFFLGWYMGGVLVGGIRGVLSLIISLGVALGFGAACWYLRHLTTLPIDPTFFPPTLASVRRRQTAQIALWYLIALEASFIPVHFANASTPCAWLDVPRRLTGCVDVLRRSTYSYDPYINLLVTSEADNSIQLWSMPRWTPT